MDKTNALSLTGGGMFDGGWTPVWLIKDEFTDTVAAGSVNGTAATPGPGTRTVVDVGSRLSIGSGIVSISSSNTDGDPGIWYSSVPSTSGLALVQRTKSTDPGKTYYVGWDTNQTATPGGASLTFRSTGKIQRGALGADIGDFTYNNWYTTAIVYNSAAHLFLANLSGVWTVLYVDRGIAAGGYPSVVGSTSLYQVDYARVIALPAPFDTDTGIATDVLSGSVAAGTTFSHTADMLLEFTATTLPSAGAIRIGFRQVDTVNTWQVYVNSFGDILLYERISNTPTARGSAGAVVTPGTRVVVICSDESIKIYSSDTLRISYGSAASFKTATAGAVMTLDGSSAVSNLKAWPRTLSGTAASILNKASG